jgi:hypothetical protein
MTTYYDERTGQTFEFDYTVVVLTAVDYDSGEDDPVEGTEFECNGIAIGLNDHEEHIIRVDWDNGQSNDYRPEDLRIVGLRNTKAMSANNPNRTFKIKRREDETITKQAKYAEESPDFNKLTKLLNATGIGMIDGAKALGDTGGDLYAAIDLVSERQTLTHEDNAGDYFSEGGDDTTDPEPDAEEMECSHVVSNVREIMGRTGMNVVVATKMLEKHDGDVDAAITYYNLNRLSDEHFARMYGEPDQEPDQTEHVFSLTAQPVQVELSTVSVAEKIQELGRRLFSKKKTVEDIHAKVLEAEMDECTDLGIILRGTRRKGR